MAKKIKFNPLIMVVVILLGALAVYNAIDLSRKGSSNRTSVTAPSSSESAIRQVRVHDDDYDSGYEDGYDDASRYYADDSDYYYDQGYNCGHEWGYDDGYSEGYSECYDEAFFAGMVAGYSIGYADGAAGNEFDEGAVEEYYTYP